MGLSHLPRKLGPHPHCDQHLKGVSGVVKGSSCIMPLTKLYYLFCFQQESCRAPQPMESIFGNWISERKFSYFQKRRTYNKHRHRTFSLESLKQFILMFTFIKHSRNKRDRNRHLCYLNYVPCHVPYTSYVTLRQIVTPRVSNSRTAR